MRATGAESWARGHPLVVDGAFASCAGLLVAWVAMTSSSLLSAVLLLQYVALGWRRVRPVLCAAAVFAAAFVVWLLIVRSSGELTAAVPPSGLPVLVAEYTLAAHGPRWARWAGLGVALLGSLLAASTLLLGLSADYVLVRADFVRVLDTAGVLAVVALLAWTAGQWRRTRLAYVESLLDRARTAEREREQQAAIATAAERARIARELHDIVAHSLSIIIAQADGGRYAADGAPQAAIGALETVALTGREALTEMRRLLGVLREGDGVETTPQPDAASLPDLIAAVRASGQDVTMRAEGTARELPLGAGLAVYRTVQEALTNVLKHAGPGARTVVRLSWTSTGLELTIEDDGRGAAAHDDGVGRGLTGMRERMALYDGHVHAAPRAGGGFAVRADLPWPGAA